MYWRRLVENNSSSWKVIFYVLNPFNPFTMDHKFIFFPFSLVLDFYCSYNERRRARRKGMGHVVVFSCYLTTVNEQLFFLLFRCLFFCVCLILHL